MSDTKDQPNPQGGNEEGTPSPTLIVPYTPTDIGLGRPLAMFWDCPSILIDGVHVTGQQVNAGTTVALDCKIKNVGDADAWAYVNLYWHRASPTPSVPTLIGTTPGVLLPPDKIEYAAGSINWIVDAAVTATADGGHPCLLAEIWSAEHLPTGTFDPAGDPRFAQMNLSVLSAVAAKPVSFTFHASNSHNTSLRALIEAHPLTAMDLSQLAGRLRARAQRVNGDSVKLRDRSAALQGAAGSRVELQLRPHEDRPIELVFDIPAGLDTGSFVGVEILQTEIVQDKRQVTGGLAVVAFGRTA